MKHADFNGIFTALITPFSANGQEIDWKDFEHLIEWQISQGIHGLVPCGTTGETPVLSDDEYRQVITRCLEITNGRVPVIAGAGSNNTSKSIAMGHFAKDAGADAILVVAPYYNKPTQDALYAHFEAVEKSVPLPMIVYNIPGRSVVDIQATTLQKIAALPNVIGVKDATGDLSRPTPTRLLCGDDFLQLSGEDATIPAFLAQGGHGAISVSSNIAPALYVALYDAWMAGDMDQMQQIRDRLSPLAEAMFIESSPAPVKYAASLMGLCHEQLRLPLLPCSAGSRPMVERIVETLDLKKTYSDFIAAHEVQTDRTSSYGS